MVASDLSQRQWRFLAQASPRESVLVRSRAVGVGNRVEVQVLLARHHGIAGARLARRALLPASVQSQPAWGPQSRGRVGRAAPGVAAAWGAQPRCMAGLTLLRPAPLACWHRCDGCMIQGGRAGGEAPEEGTTSQQAAGMISYLPLG